MRTFWKLLEKSTITSGAIAVALVGTTCYLAVTGQPVPDYIGVALGTVVGFFFGSKAQQETARVQYGRQ